MRPASWRDTGFAATPFLPGSGRSPRHDAKMIGPGEGRGEPRVTVSGVFARASAGASAQESAYTSVRVTRCVFQNGLPDGEVRRLEDAFAWE